MDKRKARRVIDQCIQDLHINLSGMHVLTEAGSGPFLYSALIAALSGASRVSVIAPDSCYASAVSLERMISELCADWGIRRDALCIHRSREGLMPGIDIVLNLGFVRPLDAHVAELCSSDGVVSYMCERWEFRAEDMCLPLFADRKIPVAGVNEDFDGFRVFASCGQLALKILFEAGVDVVTDHVVVVSDDPFGGVIIDALNCNGVSCRLAPSIEEALVPGSDVLLLAKYSDEENVLPFKYCERLKSINPNIRIVTFAGSYDAEAYKREGFNCIPDYRIPPRRMYKTLAHLGDGAVIKLHSLGLKVGELLYRKKKYGASYGRFSALVQDFEV